MSKISELLKDGIITIEEVLEYAQQHMDAVDAYDNERLGEWECEHGTLHPLSMQSCECAKYEEYQMTQDEMEYEQRRLLEEKYDDYLDEEMELSYTSHSSNPQYVIASTSFKLEETMVFEANEKGEIMSYDDYGCIAKRLGHEKMWTIRDVAVEFCLPDHVYCPIKDFGEVNGVHQCLYKRYDPEEQSPEEAALSAEARRKIFRVF